MSSEVVSERRTPLRLSAVLRVPGDGGEIRGRVRNLGRSGTLCLVLPEAAEGLEDGQCLELVLERPASASPVPGEPLELEVRLRHRREGLKTPSGEERTGLELELVDPAPETLAHVAALIKALQPAILLVGFSPESEEILGRLLGRGLPLLMEEDAEAALELLAEREIAVLCIGDRMKATAAADFLRRAIEKDPSSPTVNLVLAGGTDPYVFQDLVSEDRIYYLTQKPVLDADLVAILRSAMDRWWSRRLGTGRQQASGDGARTLQGIVEVARRVALQRSLNEAGELTVEAIRELVSADRGHYLIYEPDQEMLWSGEPGSRSHRQESAAVGLVSFVARTGRALLVDRLGDDPRHEREADDPEGTGRERVLVVPVRGSNRSVLAVLVAVREEDRSPFSDRDLAHLEMLADQVASSFSQLVLQERLDRLSRRSEDELRETHFSLFREEAVERYASGASEHGDVLRLSPRWTRWTYWLLLVLLVVGAAFSLIFHLREWATGPAVVEIQGNRDLTATSAGVVTAVEVSPGDLVEEGQLLVRFYGAQEMAELDRIEQEFEMQLINRLRNPADRGAEAALIQLRAQRRLAQARLAERTVRAPMDGVVSDVRVREGTNVAPGNIVLSMASEGTEPKVVALLPGQYRPLLEPGMPLRLEVSGYEYAYLDLTIESVGTDVVGPNEAKRYLSPEVMDAVQIPGPVVFVEARLPGTTFESGGKHYTFHDGMLANAEAPVRSDVVLLSLFPRLRQVMEAWYDEFEEGG